MKSTRFITARGFKPERILDALKPDMVTIERQGRRAITVSLAIHNHERTADVLRRKFSDLDIVVSETLKQPGRPAINTPDDE